MRPQTKKKAQTNRHVASARPDGESGGFLPWDVDSDANSPGCPKTSGNPAYQKKEVKP